MILTLSLHERQQFKFLLPVNGSLKTIETVDGILLKINDKANNDIEIDFSENEIICLKKYISILDAEENLNFQSLSLIKKILGSK